MRHLTGPLTIGLALMFASTTTSPAPVSGQAAISTADMASIFPRAVGPAVTGGRIHDVEVHPDAPSTILVGSASGGLWKTTNRGQTWTNSFADMPVSTFGDIAIARSNRFFHTDPDP